MGLYLPKPRFWETILTKVWNAHSKGWFVCKTALQCHVSVRVIDRIYWCSCRKHRNKSIQVVTHTHTVTHKRCYLSGNNNVFYWAMQCIFYWIHSVNDLWCMVVHMSILYNIHDTNGFCVMKMSMGLLITYSTYKWLIGFDAIQIGVHRLIKLVGESAHPSINFTFVACSSVLSYN